MRHPRRGDCPRLAHTLIYPTAIAVALAASGCQMTQPPNTPTATAPTGTTPTGIAPTGIAPTGIAALTSLPSLEQTTHAVQAAIDQTTAAASSAVPGLRWSTATNGQTSHCPDPYSDTAARSVDLPNRIGEHAVVSEPQWSAIEAAARAAAATVQATEIQVMHNSPANHDVGFYGPAGLFLKVAYRQALVVAGSTGCRLPQ